MAGGLQPLPAAGRGGHRRPRRRAVRARPLEGETYPLDDDTLDLEPLVRDALLLELPLAPLCTEDCAGLCPSCGADRNETQCDCRVDDTDPRWAALRSLEL